MIRHIRRNPNRVQPIQPIHPVRKSNQTAKADA